jgi:hypothetical protein
MRTRLLLLGLERGTNRHGGGRGGQEGLKEGGRKARREDDEEEEEEDDDKPKGTADRAGDNGMGKAGREGRGDKVRWTWKDRKRRRT